jgi:PhnB protein
MRNRLAQHKLRSLLRKVGSVARAEVRQGMRDIVGVAESERDSILGERALTMKISLMLAVESAATAAAWYKRAPGATELWNLGSVVGLRIEDAPFFLHEPTQSGFVSPATSRSTTLRVEGFVEDPDAFIRRAVEGGADGSFDQIRDHRVPWGVHRQGGFRDPFGHVWLVGDESPLEQFPRAPR